ncbi:hypothetical protein TeGR_g5024 [Tetraparma gracilis]|uniref:J domain-containing protein n=1 Tax=Tetraparma gracilis TaxID=2962635 RepID=A0ABQ6MVH3_9STRA|nr:hypothetical protein TeGR_g5024 [Tetraparma gracilis]
MYASLGVPPSASQQAVARAYRRQCVRHHPDKGGSREQFDRLQGAYGTLSDPGKRSAYDRFGVAGDSPDSSLASPFSSSSLFREMFGSSPRQARHRDVSFSLSLSLADLYLGSTKTVSLPLGGAGASRHKQLDVPVPRGLPDGATITLPGAISHVPGALPGDALLRVATLRHKAFERSGNDLRVELRVSLLQSLAGFELPLTHLDGRELLLSSGGPVRHGDELVLEGEGMPVPGRLGEFGRLFARVEVEMPEIDEGGRERLREALGGAVEEGGEGEGAGEKAELVSGKGEVFGGDERGQEGGRRGEAENPFYRGNGFGSRDFQGIGGEGGVECAQM